ncbi:MAG: hypothetical protein WDZ35_08765 [Crocinitomicaceae bacterium]
MIKNVKFCRAKVKCKACNGTGWLEAGLMCGTCGGTGYVDMLRSEKSNTINRND